MATTQSRFSWAIAQLDAAQKPAQGVPAYMRWVNRRGARVVAALGYQLGWTPNQVTAISAGLSVAGMLVLIFAPFAVWTGVAAAVLLALGFLFDSADGQLARVSKLSSKSGEWVDHVVDAFRSPLIHVAVVIAVTIHDGPYPWLALVALAYSVITSGQFLSQILAEALVRKAGAKQTRGGNLRSWILLPTDPGVLCWSFVFWGWAPAFAVVYGLLAAVAAAHSAVSLTRRFTDLSAVDRAAAELADAPSGGARA